MINGITNKKTRKIHQA